MKTVKVTPDNIISAIDVNFDDFRDLQKAVGDIVFAIAAG